MRFRLVTALGAAALLVGAGAAPAPAATAQHATRPGIAAHGHGPHIRPSAPAAGNILLDRNDRSHDTGVGIVSQTFEPEFHLYNTAAADDFTVPANTTWRIRRVAVTGTYFDGTGEGVSATVTFYRNSAANGGLPGAPISSVTVGNPDRVGLGSFNMRLGNTVKLKGGHAGGTTYWVSVVADMDFSVGGEWGWETQNIQFGNPSAWENPEDGFGTGCITWGTTNSCIGQGEGPDYLFALYGRAASRS
jgi:hypothetical protein